MFLNVFYCFMTERKLFLQAALYNSNNIALQMNATVIVKARGKICFYSTDHKSKNETNVPRSILKVSEKLFALHGCRCNNINFGVLLKPLVRLQETLDTLPNKMTIESNNAHLEKEKCILYKDNIGMQIFFYICN